MTTSMSMGVPDPLRDPQFYDGVILRRLFAFIIDLAITVILLLLVGVIGTAITVVTAGLGVLIAVPAAFATGFLYRWFFLARRSATLGMIFTGLEVRDANGRQMDGATAFLHTAGYHVTFLFPPLVVIGWVMMIVSPYRRAMHDFFLGTVVINRPN